ncbi:MAG: hypothetical protein RL033_691 [Pseudomonadota bacterium]
MEEVSRVEPSSTLSGGDGSDSTESRAPAEETYRSHFAAWLSGMSEEARQLAFLLEREEASAPLRRLAADSLNQLLHAADMLPEGTEALGYLETLFAFRLLAAEQSEAAFSAARLPKPRRPKVEPAVLERLEPVEDADPLMADAFAESSEAEDAEAEAAVSEAAVSEETEETQAMAAEPSEAVGAEAVGAEGERGAVPLPAAAETVEEETLEAEAAEAEALAAEALAAEAEAEALEAESAELDLAAALAAQLEEEPEEEPERAQASDESYTVARRLAPQAALVRAFLGADDAERLRRLVLEQRNRTSRGRTSKEILLAIEARAAAASEAREWADAFEAPAFGSTQHDLLRLRTFMKTRARRGAS